MRSISTVVPPRPGARDQDEGAMWFPRRWGAVVWFVTLAAFAVLTAFVVNGWSGSWDSMVSTWAFTTRGHSLTQVARAVTWSGTFPFIVVFAVGAAAALDWWFTTPWRCVVRVVLVLCADFVVVAVTKSLVARPRPPVDQRLVAVSTLSFPSGHATATAAVVSVLFLTVVAATQDRTARFAALSVAVLAALAMDWSRVYLGVHYLTDVVGGTLLGVWLALSAAWLFDTVAARRRVSASPSRRQS